MPQFWIARKLREDVERHGSVSSLANAIKLANRGKRSFDRRKIAAIVGGHDFSLKRDDFLALEAYLAINGDSLTKTPFLKPSGILHTLEEMDRTVCFVPARCESHGSKPREHGDPAPRDYTDLWDMRAFAQLLESFNRSNSKAHVTLCEAPRFELEDQPYPPTKRAQIAESLLGGHLSVCCVGGMLVSPLTEYMLANMLGVSPFESATAASARPTPFQFAYHPRKGASSTDLFPSRFALTAHDLRNSELQFGGEDIALAVAERDAKALVIDGKVFPSWIMQETYDDFGIIAAQRRPNGDFWTVVVGMSGPGTYGAASLLRDVWVDIKPSTEKSLHTVYAVARVPVRRELTTETQHDFRKVDDGQVEFLLAPRVWTADNPNTGRSAA